MSDFCCKKTSVVFAPLVWQRYVFTALNHAVPPEFIGMKRYRFVLVLLILTVSATGCRRRCNLFGRRGAPCATQTVYSPPPVAPAAPTTQVVCPTVCPDNCPAVYGGEVMGGDVMRGDVMGGDVMGDSAIPNSTFVEPYNGASLTPGSIPSLGGSAWRDIAPSLPSPAADSGQNVYGRPMFQVVGDRRLNPGETLPDLEGETSAPTKSDKAAQASNR